MWLTPVTLQGKHVTLLPLEQQYLEALKTAVADGDIWKVRAAQVPHPDEMDQEIKRRLKLQENGLMLPFVVLNQQKKVVGMTCYSNIDNDNKRTDIGWTWYCKSAQKTALNTECKSLLLQQAFEFYDAIAVGFKVDALNYRSQIAVERIGAKKEGIIRNYSLLNDGNLRDMIFYSILPSEWPNIKAHLKYLQDQ
ncbi:MAG: GNAT family protein [Legionella sp.]|nr:GNAT family protein [Legionella sp.]